MRWSVSLTIVGILLSIALRPAGAARAPSEWPSLNSDAAQSNANPAEKSLTARSVLKLKVLWTSPVPSAVSYPVVAGGRVYAPFTTHGHVFVRALDAATGKRLATYQVDARGGILAVGSSLYLAGHSLTIVDAATGHITGQVTGQSTSTSAMFLNPVADAKILLVGYASQSQASPNRVYAIDLQSHRVLWKAASSTALGAIGMGRIFTVTSSGSTFYAEPTGKTLARQRSVFSDWFSGDGLAFTVAAVGRGKATLYAVDKGGHTIWKALVGPRIATTGWAHAVGPAAIYVSTLKPTSGVEAVDPMTGSVLWRRSVPDVQRLVLANNAVFVLTFGLGQPVHVVALNAKSGAVMGTLALSSGYYAFSDLNGLMVADGMLFIRAEGPNGGELLALGT